MRLIVLSDIHDNLTALQAVMADIALQPPADHIWVLGDLVLGGARPASCVEPIRSLPDVRIIQGNADRYLVSGGYYPWPPATSADDLQNKIQALAHREAVRQWTYKQLSYADYAFLRDLPTELELEIEGYGKLAAYHAAPGDDEYRIVAETKAEEVAEKLAGVSATCVLVGHTHIPFDRQAGNWRVLNPGSVGLPYDGDPSACYAVLEFESSQLRFEVRRVAYDIEKEIELLAALDHPDKEALSVRLRTGYPR